MPSRKREKGKQRRQAGKLATKQQLVCHHGIRRPLPDNAATRAVYEYMDIFSTHLDNKSKSPGNAAIKDIHEKWIEMDVGFWMEVKTSIVSAATDLVLDNKLKVLARHYALAILYIEASILSIKDTEVIDYVGVLRDLQGGTTRDVVAFIRKRAPCSCLDPIYAQVRDEPKVGKCHNCDKSFERKLLRLCGGCRLFQFCSVECQTESWPSHKDQCHEIKNSMEAVKREVAERASALKAKEALGDKSDG